MIVGVLVFCFLTLFFYLLLRRAPLWQIALAPVLAIGMIAIMFWWTIRYDLLVFGVIIGYYLIFIFSLTAFVLFFRHKSIYLPLIVPIYWIAYLSVVNLVQHSGALLEISVFYLYLPSISSLGSINVTAIIVSLAVLISRSLAHKDASFLLSILLLAFLLIPSSPPPFPGTISVLLVQGNHDRDWEWRSEHVGEIADEYLFLSQGEEELVVWPEYAIAGELPDSLLSRLEALSQNKTIVVGHPTEVGLLHHDSASVFSGGERTHLYHSVAPIFFNEQTLPGQELVTFTVNDITFGIIICYEEMDRRIFRHYQQNGADAIISLVNNQHVRGTPGEWLTAAFVDLRAKEFGIPILRATNTGMTKAVSADGRIIASLEPGKSAALPVFLDQ